MLKAESSRLPSSVIETKLQSAAMLAKDCGTGPERTKACCLRGFSIVVKDNQESNYGIGEVALPVLFI